MNQIKEILKQTSERKGEPTYPDIDPYWNRDFGYGMADAHAAVTMAIYLKETSQSEYVNPYLQNHLLSQTIEDGIINITGHAWGQDSSVDKIEFRIDDGPWNEVTYTSTDSKIGPLTPFLWHILIDSSKVTKGVHQIEIHASSDASISLPTTLIIEGSGGYVTNSNAPISVIMSISLLFMAWISTLIFAKFNTDEDENFESIKSMAKSSRSSDISNNSTETDTQLLSIIENMIQVRIRNRRLQTENRNFFGSFNNNILELFTYGPLFGATFFSFKILCFSLKNYKNSVPSLYQILLPFFIMYFVLIITYPIK